MRRRTNPSPDYTRHYVLQEIGMVKGYKVINDTSETEGLIVNHIHIEINLSSKTGYEFYEEIKDKFKPEDLKCKYINAANYMYGESKNEDQITIEITLLTNRKLPKDIKAKKKILSKINKYT